MCITDSKKVQSQSQYIGSENNYYGKDILLGLKSTTMKNTDIVTAWDSPVSHIMQHLCHTKRKKKRR